PPHHRMPTRTSLPPPLFSREAIAARVAELATDIRREYAGTDGVHFVCVLKGAFVFFADLVRALSLPGCTLDFIVVSSYQKATRTSGEVRLIKDLDTGIE